MMNKKWIFLPSIIVILIFGIGLTTDYPSALRHVFIQPVYASEISSSSSVPPIDIVSTMIGEVNQERIITDLRKLTGAEQICIDSNCYTIANRRTGSVGLQWAKDYVYEELTNLGYSVEVQNWSRSGYEDQNLIVKKQGLISPGEEIYFVAHMDGVTSPAADDNASGVVSLLELARILRSHAISRSVVLLFSTGEEQGALGVHSYIAQLTQEQLNSINYVVDADMLGYDANNDGIMELWNGTQPLDFVQLLMDIISSYQIDLHPQIVSDCG